MLMCKERQKREPNEMHDKNMAKTDNVRHQQIKINKRHTGMV